jgi:dihydroxyacid dehydratase/phosphogluconate dehydratase
VDAGTDIDAQKSLGDAAAVRAASGGRSDAALHMGARAGACAIPFDLFDVGIIFKKTPYVADLKPGGRDVAKDMFQEGSIPLLNQNKPVTAMNGAVGLTGNAAPEGAAVKVAGMSILKFSRPACDFPEVEVLNVNLTDAERVARQTKWQSRETNPTSGEVWKHAGQAAPATSAVTRGGLHEMCDADI